MSQCLHINPLEYEQWYHTPKGKWIADNEFQLIKTFLTPDTRGNLLDVGCGTGYFSRRFAKLGFHVTGIDIDDEMLDFARSQNQKITYLPGAATKLPFKNLNFDYSAAITSLCFVDDPVRALAEMWRVSEKGIILGLLNYNSLLYRQKHDQGSYTGARWDRWVDVNNWISYLTPAPVTVQHKTAIFIPDGSNVARIVEQTLPHAIPWGGFLAVYIAKF